MKTLTITFLFVIFTLSLGYSQIDDLLKNPDIVWVGEIELEYVLEPNSIKGKTSPDKLITPGRGHFYQIKKYDFGNCNDILSLGAHIIELIKNGKISTFETSSQEKKLTEEDIDEIIMPFDTIIYFQPETFEELVIFGKEHIDTEHITSYIIKQVWYYNQKEQSLKTKVLGMSLVYSKYYFTGPDVRIQKKILCYVAFPDISDPALQINSPNVPFCMETMESIDFSAFKVLKGESRKTFEQVFFQLPKEQKIDIFSAASGYCCNEIVDKEEHYRIFEHTVDTVITFHPITYDETVRTDENPALTFHQYNDIYRVKQIWYFDAKSHQLVSKLNSVAPTKAEYDENGNFLFDYALFYLCFSQKDQLKGK